MRLDHLLSKEHLACSGCPGVVLGCWVGRGSPCGRRWCGRRCFGWNVNQAGRVRGVRLVQLSPARACVSCFRVGGVGAGGGGGNGCVGGSGGRVGTLLGPEGTVACVPAGCGVRVGGVVLAGSCCSWTVSGWCWCSCAPVVGVGAGGGRVRAWVWVRTWGRCLRTAQWTRASF